MRRTTRPMHVASLGLLLLCASVPAMARSGVNAAANGESSCPTSEDAATERARQAAESHSKTTTTPTAKPAARAAGSSVSRGGDDSVPLRTHGTKWHSFLPGMFR